MAAKKVTQASISRFFAPKPAAPTTAAVAAAAPAAQKKRTHSSPRTKGLEQFAAGTPNKTADESTPSSDDAQGSTAADEAAEPSHKRVRRILVENTSLKAAAPAAIASKTAADAPEVEIMQVDDDESSPISTAENVVKNKKTDAASLSKATGGRSASKKAAAAIKLQADDVLPDLDSFAKDKSPLAQRDADTDDGAVIAAKTGRPSRRRSSAAAATKEAIADDEDAEPELSEDTPEPSTATGTEPMDNVGSLSAATAGLMARRLAAKHKNAADVRAALMREARTPKLTPLEKQFVDFKTQMPDAVLLIEVGYKFQFFGEDAEAAAKVLSIYCAAGHNNFRVASIPVERLFVHVRRLVEAGFKVGVVRQTETAALKKIGANKSKLFTRELTGLYTKATLVGADVGGDATEADAAVLAANSTNYLLCLCEVSADSETGTAQFGLLALQCATGDMIYDAFSDDLSRLALETRLAHLAPSEVVLPPRLSERTEKLLRAVAATAAQADGLREERLSFDVFDPQTSVRRMTAFFDEAPGGGAHLAAALALPAPVQTCLAAMIHHLKTFKLEKLLRTTSAFQPFSIQGTSMLMNANTLRNLEIVSNTSDGQLEGSLLWLMDHTVTAFGKRLLRRWITHPLVDIDAIRARQDAVAELLNNDEKCIVELQTHLKSLPDLERGLTSIYYGRSAPLEVVAVLSALETLRTFFDCQASAASSVLQSPLLLSAFENIPQYFEAAPGLAHKLDADAAKAKDMVHLLKNCPDLFPSQDELETALRDVDARLFRHRSEIRKIVGNPAQEYVTVSGEDYLIEVKHKDVPRLPKDWVQISGTKSVSRYRTPLIVEQLELRSQLRERLALDAKEAWARFMAAVSDHFEDFRRGVQLLAQLDCLFSLAHLAGQEHYTRPELVADAPAGEIVIKQGRHPMVSAAMSDQYVPNDTALDGEGLRCHLITGPNMGGKSSYIRQVALLSVMAQIGSFVPAEEARLAVLDAIYTRMGASDNIFKGASTFMVELQEAAEALNKATSRSLVIMDELGRGTSTHDGVAIAYATMKYLVEEVRCLTLFVTHYPSLAELAVRLPGQVACYHMAFLETRREDAGEPSEEKTDSSNSTVSFLYQLTPGLAHRSYGLNVARLAGLPSAVLEKAAEQSHLLEQRVARRRPLDAMSAAIVTALCSALSIEDISEALKSLRQVEG